MWGILETECSNQWGVWDEGNEGAGGTVTLNQWCIKNKRS